MKILEFLLDTAHAALLYPSGLTRPHIAYGCFAATQEGRYQRMFFDELRRQGLLENIKHEKWNKAIILVDSKDEHQVAAILKKMGLKTLILKISKYLCDTAHATKTI